MPYKVIRLRRRREMKTDYNARISMLKSGKTRVIIRKTNRHVIAEAANSDQAQDSTVCYANSKELLKLGIGKDAENTLKSIAAAYLTGYLLGTKMKKANIKEAIVDFGLARSTRGSRIYAAVKGVIDAGIKMNCDKGMFPSEERINCSDMKKKIDVQKIKSAIK